MIQNGCIPFESRRSPEARLRRRVAFSPRNREGVQVAGTIPSLPLTTNLAGLSIQPDSNNYS